MYIFIHIWIYYVYSVSIIASVSLGILSDTVGETQYWFSINKLYASVLFSVFKRCFQSQSNFLLQICWVSSSLVFILSLDEGFQDSAFVLEIFEGKNVECFVCRFIVNKLLSVESST